MLRKMTFNIGLLFFSGTGNSLWVARRFKEIGQKYDWDVSLIPISKEITNEPEEIANRLSNYKVIGLSFPIYGANLPPVVERFLSKVKKGQSLILMSREEPIPEKSCIVLPTIGYVNGYGPFMIRGRIRNLGWNLVGHVNCRIANNACTPLLKSGIPDADKIKKRLNKVSAKLEELADKIDRGRRYIKGIGPWLLAGYIIRKVSADGIKNHYKTLSVDKDRCTECFICRDSCPTGSIRFLDGEFSFSESCTSCLRCYNFCPANAILIDGEYASPDEYKRYKGSTRGTLARLRDLESLNKKERI